MVTTKRYEIVSTKVITKALTGDNQFSNPGFFFGKFNFSLKNSGTATVKIYRLFDDEVSGQPNNSAGWYLVKSYIYTGTHVSVTDEEIEGAWYRFGIETSEYTSGTIDGRISQ